MTEINARDAAWKRRDSRIFEREQHDHYVEPGWCSERLFEVEKFDSVWDPCCGWGRIVDAAIASRLEALGSDIVDRADGRFPVIDFLDGTEDPRCQIVCNPPFDVARKFAERALRLADKVAMIWLWRRLPAARWLAHTPLARVWLMTPRPSMPSGEFIAKSGKVGGGTQDFCWLVWDKSHSGPPEMRWLHRDGAP